MSRSFRTYSKTREKFNQINHDKEVLVANKFERNAKSFRFKFAAVVLSALEHKKGAENRLREGEEVGVVAYLA